MALAVITGASSGIGRDLAWICARAGYNTLLVARSEDALRALAAQISTETGTTSTPLRADLSDRASADSVADAALSSRDSIEILVNNAGYGDLAPFADASWEKLSSIIDIHVWSVLRLTYRLAPSLCHSERGKIMNVASTAGFQPVPYFATYASAKSFLIRFSVALDHELRGKGTSVTVLCPGSTATGFHAASGTGSALVDHLDMANSMKVAQAGFNGMMIGKRIVVPGLFNKIGHVGVRFFPDTFIARLAALAMRPRKKV